MLNPYGYPFISRYDSTYDQFGTLTLTVGETSQVFTEPLLLADLKSYLSISDDDTSNDLLLNTFITAARDQAELLQGRDLVRKQYDLVYDYWPSYRIQLRPWTVSIDLIETKNLTGAVTTLTQGTDYVFDLAKQPAVITPPWNISWPTFTPFPSSGILIRFTSGITNTDQFWAGPGARIKVGMMLLISAWFENRLPFEKGITALNEYPFAVTSCLSYGSLNRAR